METLAVLLTRPGELELTQVALIDPAEGDIIVDVQWSGISTGTERLLYTGRMPQFPGMGYPLVPGYESVGTVIEAGPAADREVGDLVFVPGANCYRDVRGLFGGSAKQVIVPSHKAVRIDAALGEQGTMLALAATAQHALAEGRPPELIVGHGALGRLLARLTIAAGHASPVVWETNPLRAEGAQGYAVIAPDTDERRNYASICDVSGDPKLLDTLISHLAPGGEIVLAGFYSEPLSFSFPPAFMREARLRVAAQWKPGDLHTVARLIGDGRLSFDGLISHRQAVGQAQSAYRTAFEDPQCLKMVLDWREAK